MIDDETTSPGAEPVAPAAPAHPMPEDIHVHAEARLFATWDVTRGVYTVVPAIGVSDAAEMRLAAGRPVGVAWLTMPETGLTADLVRQRLAEARAKAGSPILVPGTPTRGIA